MPFSSNSFNAFLTTPQSITQKAFNAAADVEERERKEEAQLTKEFYYGKQEQSITLLNEDVDPVMVNLIKPVIDKRCRLLYNRPLKRTFEGSVSSAAFVEEVYKSVGIDNLMQQADTLSELTGSVLLHPYPDETADCGYRIRIYDATQFSAVGNDGDPNTADAISLVRVVDRVPDHQRLGQDGSVKSERTLDQQIWTNEAVVYYEGQIIKHSVENELGFMPFVNIHGEEVHDEFIGYASAINIRKTNQYINQLLTGLCHMVKMQAGTPIALSGFSAGETVILHPGRALNMPSGATADVLQLNPKILETINVIQYLEDRLFSTSAVPRVTIEGGDGDKTHISGAQLVVRWSPLVSLFNQKAVKFQRYELQLANMLCNIVGLPPLEKVHIDYPEESIIPAQSDVQETEQDIKLGLANPVDILQKQNALFTDEQAFSKWEENMEINERVKVATDGN